MPNYVFVNRPFDADEDFDTEALNRHILDFVTDNHLPVQHIHDGQSTFALDVMIDKLIHGDTVYLWSWRCLPVTTTNLPLQVLSIVNRIRSRGAELCCVQENLDTSSPNDRLTLTQLTAFEQFNLDVQIRMESPRKHLKTTSPRSFEPVAISQYTGC